MSDERVKTEAYREKRRRGRVEYRKRWPAFGAHGRQHKAKIVHPGMLSAVRHIIRLAYGMKDPHLLWKLGPYRCRWGAQWRDGEVFRAHWHIGHRRDVPHVNRLSRVKVKEE